MKKLVFIITSVFILSCATNKETNISINKRDLSQVKTALQELNEALKQDNGKLWNYKLNGPILFIDRETRTIFSNKAAKKGRFKKHEKLFIGKYPENKNIANTSTNWLGNSWTMVALPLPETKEKRLDLLIHESFHRIQPLIGFDSISEKQNLHLDKKTARIYLKLELEALKKALISEKADDHIKNALIFRQFRHQLFPGSKASENTLELIEGLPEYTSSTLSGRSDNELRTHYTDKINWFYTIPTFVRSFAYFTTPVYGYFMKQKDEKWNFKINKKTNLSDFIKKYYPIPEKEISKEEINEIGLLYNANSIIAFEEDREQKQLKIIENYKSTFINEKALKIKLENMHIGFNPGNITPLENYGTIYPNARITDNWGILKVDSGGVLMDPNWSQITLSCPNSYTDSTVNGDYWNIKLNKTWKLKEDNGVYALVKE